MTTPYRDRELRCPACGDAQLREIATDRYVCDKCYGLYTSRADFVKSIEELGGMAVELKFFKDAQGQRRCPHCGLAMMTCRLRLEFPVIDKDPKTHPVLDRCDADGIWFDANELAEVYEVVVHAGGGRGHGATLPATMRPGNGRGWGFGV